MEEKDPKRARVGEPEKDGLRNAKRIALDVGGTKFATSLTTLNAVPDSMLAVMFSGRFPLEPDESGCYFIDRDPTLFRHILNWLRRYPSMLKFDAAALNLSSGQRKELYDEAGYYGLQPLQEQLQITSVPKIVHEPLKMCWEIKEFKRGIKEIRESKPFTWLGWQWFLTLHPPKPVMRIRKHAISFGVFNQTGKDDRVLLVEYSIRPIHKDQKSPPPDWACTLRQPFELGKVYNKADALPCRGIKPFISRGTLWLKLKATCVKMRNRVLTRTADEANPQVDPRVVMLEPDPESDSGDDSDDDDGEGE